MSADRRPFRLPEGTDPVRFVTGLSRPRRRLFAAAMASEDGEALDADWPSWAHEGQRPRTDDWSTWVLVAGRGFGKTLAGAQWLLEHIVAHDRDGGERLGIALVGASLDDARRVMVEGRSGLLTVAADWIDDWSPSLRRLRFITGAQATLFSGCSPDLLRGPEHHLAWCDELAKWEKPQECWDMLQFGLRLGDHPRALVTTTPQTGTVLRAIMAAPGVVKTHGRTRANPHLSAAWKARMEALYAGTRLGRQELDGELLPEAGALWTVELIASCRAGWSAPPPPSLVIPDAIRDPASSSTPPRHGEGDRPPDSGDGGGGPVPGDPPNDPPPLRGGGGASEASAGGGQSIHRPTFARTLIAVDPPSGDGTCGIIAVAREGEGDRAIAHVLADHSVTGRSPEGWARAVAAACAAHATREVVAESNQGGRMVSHVLQTADASLQVRLVTASQGKSHRAEPVAHLCEAGRVRLHGPLRELEAQLLGLIAGGGYEGPGASPDRADAMVWGVTEVMREVGVRVRGM